MILQYEIEHLIKLFEQKDNETSRSVIAVLDRILIALSEDNRLLRVSMQNTQEESLQGLNLLKENIELKKEVDKLTGLLNEFNDEG